jgi:hypothetical protein
MLNPFDSHGTTPACSEQFRRKKLKIGVYTILAMACALIVGMLIQGCRSQQAASAPTHRVGP